MERQKNLRYSVPYSGDIDCKEVRGSSVFYNLIWLRVVCPRKNSIRDITGKQRREQNKKNTFVKPTSYESEKILYDEKNHLTQSYNFYLILWPVDYNYSDKLIEMNNASVDSVESEIKDYSTSTLASDGGI